MSSSSDQELLDKMSAAYYEATVDQLIDAVSSRAFDSNKALAFFQSCDNETDRATPVLIFSYIENAIRELFSAELSPGTPGGVKSLFDAFGPLATTSARIRMLAAIDWISPETAKSLDIIRRIRNEFAHNPPDDGFLNEKICSLVGSIHSYEEGFLEPSFLKSLDLPVVDQTKLDGRTLFVIRTGLAFSHLVQELLTAPKALRLGLPASAALARDHKKLPKILRDVQGLGIRILLHAVYPSGLDGRW
jgi:DNA-binding MltR family transcriptional regulator